MVFHRPYLKPLNKPFELTLSPFVGTVNFLTKPRFLKSQKPLKNFSRSEIKEISNSSKNKSSLSIDELTKNRLFEIERLLIEKLKLKPRVAVEFEFTFRDKNGAPVKLVQKERDALDEILREELQSFQESDKSIKATADAEYKFDTKGKISLKQLLNDIDNFKKNLSRYQDEVSIKTGIKRPDLVIDDSPYQPQKGHLGIFHDNTTSLHVNISLEDVDGKNVFNTNPDSLKRAVASILNFQLPSLALSSDKEGMDRIHKGSSSTNTISAGENNDTGGFSRYSKVVSATTLSLSSVFSLIIANSGAALQSPVEFYSWSVPLLFALIADKKLNASSSSVSFRTKLSNEFKALLQKFQKRSAKTDSATRVENRLSSANQDPALAILNTLYPVYKTFQNDDSAGSLKLSEKKGIPQSPEDLLSHALSAEKELRELYGDELFDLLLSKAVDEFFPESNS